MSEQKEEDFPLKIDLGTENGGEKSFETLQELELWVEKQSRSWGWFTKLSSGPSGPLKNLADKINAHFDKILTGLRSYKEGNNSIGNVRINFGPFNSNDLFVDHSPTMKLFKKLHAKDPKLGEFATLYLFEDQHHLEYRAMIEVMLHQKSITEDARVLALDEQVKTYESMLEEHKNQFVQEVETNETERKSLCDDVAVEKEALATFVQNQQQELEKLKAYYKSIKTIEEPESYWDSKRKKHSWCAFGWGGVSLLFGVALLLLVMGFFDLMQTRLYPQNISLLRDVLEWDIAKKLSTTPTKTPPPKTTQHKSATMWDVLPSLLPAIVLLLISVWITRVCVRMYISHTHLAADADERIVLCQTYRALMADEKAEIRPADRTLILTQLFRHAATGVVADDASPPSLFDLWKPRN